jgi:hypothetical protein
VTEPQRIVLPPRVTSFRAVCAACQAGQPESRGYVGAIVAGELAPGEDRSYPADAREAPIRFSLRPLTEAVPSYVDWLRRHPAAQGRARP